MDLDFKLYAEAIPVILSIGLTTVGYLLYYFISVSEVIKNRYNKIYGEKFSEKYIIFQRIVGFVCMGTIPLIIFLVLLPESLAYFGLTFANLSETVLWISGISIIIIPLVIITAKSENNLPGFYILLGMKFYSEAFSFFLSIMSWDCGLQ